MIMMLLEATIARIKDGLIDPSELSISDSSGYDTTILLSHNIQYNCTVDPMANELTIVISGVDHHISNSIQVLQAADDILSDYQSQVDEIGLVCIKSAVQRNTPTIVSTQRAKPTLTMDLTGLTPDQVKRILQITEET